MRELFIGLFGGGAVVLLLNMLLTYRQNRRQMNATALGTEVEALERAIRIISENLERQNAEHRKVVAELQNEVDTLRKRCRDLERELILLRSHSRPLIATPRVAPA